MSALRGRIAVIGWGSLLWDLDDLAPKVAGEWQMGGGPRLPFEFSRISPKRKMGLVVCLDPVFGRVCPTHAIASIRDEIGRAAADLRARERAERLDQIGAYCARTGFLRSRLPEVGPLVAEWCVETGAAGAVWTDLDSNFEALTGAPFSLPRAITYLKGLTGESLEEAVRYITFAPAGTMTPLREALLAEPWWQALAGPLATA